MILKNIKKLLLCYSYTLGHSQKARSSIKNYYNNPLKNN